MSSNFIMLFRLVNEANFFVVLIALFAIFFLLGLIIGSSINFTKKDRKEDPGKKHIEKGASDRTNITDTLGQDNEREEEKPASEQRPEQRDPRYRYYNWW